MMTGELASHITAEVQGQDVAGWRIGEQKGVGGTAVVFAATKGSQKAAIKLYSKEFIKSDREANLERIDRQRSLIDHKHPNLVKLYDAGECGSTGYVYVVMDLIDTQNMEESLGSVSRDKIPSIISQVAKAAYFLHELELVHRDIKPSNIAIDLSSYHVTLLDVGVVRPIFGESVTDSGSARQFIGTRRYAPPEFLLRKEEHTKEGWEAVTFYQLGGLLHDLIMQRPLFAELKQDELLNAVQTTVPQIDAPGISRGLIKLASDCLQKDPVVRHSLVKWSDLLDPIEMGKGSLPIRDPQAPVSSTIRNSIAKIRMLSDTAEMADLCLQQIDLLVRTVCLECPGIPPVKANNTTTLGKTEALRDFYFELVDESAGKWYLHWTVYLRVLDAKSPAVEVKGQWSASLDNKQPDSRMGITEHEVYRGTFDVAYLLGILQSQFAADWTEANQQKAKLGHPTPTTRTFLKIERRPQ